MNIVKWVETVAQVPSFSSHEERLHPLLLKVAEKVPGATVEFVPFNNMIITVPGTLDTKLIAVSAHLDKINHFGIDRTDSLPISNVDGKLTGLLDDATGVGILLALLEEIHNIPQRPTLLFLFSEMEESTGLKQAPHLLKNNGEGYYSGMGAERIAKHLIATNRIPALVATIDTTPLFKGEAGVALYSKHWEFNKIEPTEQLLKNTTAVEEWFTKNYPVVLHRNNTNDYLMYGKILNTETPQAVVSIAIEPSIFPYHCAEEGVFERDIIAVSNILRALVQANLSLRGA